MKDEELYKYLMLGNTDKSEHIKSIARTHRTNFDGAHNVPHRKFFNEFLSDEEDLFTPVHELLRPFIGVHEVALVEIPNWFGEFKTTLVAWFTSKINEINPDIATAITTGVAEGDLKKKVDKIKKLFYGINHMELSHFKEGKLSDGRKVIKSIISTIETTLSKDLNPSQTGWYKMYETKMCDSSSKRIVISNNKTAKLYMSSLFPSARSCQTIETSNCSAGAHREGLYNFVGDTASLIIYEPLDTASKPSSHDSNSPKFTQMKWRSIIRLVEFSADIYKCNECGKVLSEHTAVCTGCSSRSTPSKKAMQSIPNQYGIMLDAMYPNCQDIKYLYTLLDSICKQIGLPLISSIKNHYRQSGSDFTADCVLGKEEYVGTFVPSDIYMTHEGSCESCDSAITSSACSRCKPISKDICTLCDTNLQISKSVTSKCSNCGYVSGCRILDCSKCSIASCKRGQKVRSMYNDQVGGNYYTADIHGRPIATTQFKTLLGVK